MRKFTWRQEEDFMKATLQFSFDDAIGWIRRNLDPEDVFDIKILESWADNNNYIKE